MENEAAPRYRSPGCSGLAIYSLGAAIPAVLILLITSAIAAGDERGTPSSNLRVSISFSVLCALAVVIVISAIRARQTHRPLRWWQELAYYGWPGLALVLIVPTVEAWADAFPQPSKVTKPAYEYISFTDPDCANTPELVSAVDQVMIATIRTLTPLVHGEPSGKSNNLGRFFEESDLAAMQNPRGEGVIVTVTHAGDRVLAENSVRRTGWLVLDGILYPLERDAASAFGLDYIPLPENVFQRAGFDSGYEDLNDLGLRESLTYNSEERISVKWFMQDANQLCTTPTLWG